MAAKSLSIEDAQAALDALEKHGTLSKAGDALGISARTLQSRVNRAKQYGLSPAPQRIEATPIPSGDIPIEETIAYVRRRFEAKSAHHKAKRWRTFNVPSSGPYALMLFGDPHVDDDGCNWALLEDHCKLARESKGVHAVSIGDVTNNWVGRLMRLYANQETSVKTARQMIKWLLCDSGVPWWLWIHGNHDSWNEGIPIIEGMNIHNIAMEDWQAKVTLRASNGHETRMWATHNFPGTSQWNKLHGAQKAAQMKDWAHLYVAGHHHNWALHQEEHDHRNFVYWLARVRGYKFMDTYADHLGYGEQEYGSSVLCVIDPFASKLNAMTCFADPHEGVDFLEFKRRKLGD